MNRESFNEEQIQAIETLDKSILVSAAAGSGKTRVLIERIINIVLSRYAEVDELLVLTFTDAAASEIRQRMRRALQEALLEHEEQRDYLQSQIFKLPNADFKTFNSFAYTLVQNYFYMINVEPGVRICDEGQASLIQYEAMDEMFELGFKQDDFVPGASFDEFLLRYSRVSSEDNIKELLLSAYQVLRSMPDYINWAREEAEELNFENFANTKMADRLLADAAIEISRATEIASKLRDKFLNIELDDAWEEKLGPEFSDLSFLDNQVKENKLSLHDLEILQNFEFGRMVFTKKKWKDTYNEYREELKPMRDLYKERLKKWIDRYITNDLDRLIQETHESYKWTRYIIELLAKFEEIYVKKKREMGLLDFSDNEHYANQILTNPDIARELQNRYKFVFVDEYQDTNNIQESLISKISRPDNMFKVGDVKQSIYRFRQANPEIFLKTFAEFDDAASKESVAIEFQRNYRSNPATLEFINSIFENLLPSYDERARLKPGLDFDNALEFDYKPDVFLLSSDDQLLNPEDPEPDEEESDADNEILELRREEMEAIFIAKRIKAMLDPDSPERISIYDPKTRTTRFAEYRDITILLRSIKTRGPIMAEALEAEGIPIYLDDTSGYFDTIEIQTILALLSYIDNPTDDIALISALHSPIFEFDAVELADIRIASNKASLGASPKCSYQEALNYYIENFDNDLSIKLKDFKQTISAWSDARRFLTLSEFVYNVVHNSGYFYYAGAMDNGARRQANLRQLINKAQQFEQSSRHSLREFIQYVGILSQMEVKEPQATVRGKNDNIVRITTIHKSKGLEYPIVFVASLGSRFNKSKDQIELAFDDTLGVALPFMAEDRSYYRGTILSMQIADRNRSLEYLEQLRILYVALTRAMRKLVLVGFDVTKESSGLYPACFVEAMKPYFSEEFANFQVVQIPRYKPIKEASHAASSSHRFVKARIKPFDMFIPPSSNRSATSLNEGQESPDNEYYLRHFEGGEESVFARTGTIYHKILEEIDYTHIAGLDKDETLRYLEEQKNFALVSLHLADFSGSSIDVNKIYDFVASPLGERIKLSALRGELFREYEFVMKSQDENNAEIMVNGKIDCCFLEDGEYVLIDYKTNRNYEGATAPDFADSMIKEYKTQVNTYKQALERATGRTVKEAYLYLVMSGEFIKISD